MDNNPIANNNKHSLLTLNVNDDSYSTKQSHKLNIYVYEVIADLRNGSTTMDIKKAR